jgi:hypothetical protein
MDSLFDLVGAPFCRTPEGYALTPIDSVAAMTTAGRIVKSPEG